MSKIILTPELCLQLKREMTIIANSKNSMQSTLAIPVSQMKDLANLIDHLLEHHQAGLLNTARMVFLHQPNKDAEGYEWGVARVKFNEHGQLENCLWTGSDSSDLDAFMKQTKEAMCQTQP